MNLSPTRIDVLKDKHFAICAWSKRADNMLLRGKVEPYIQTVNRILRMAKELSLMAQTSNKKGKELSWWK